jgi:hypothetical protein
MNKYICSFCRKKGIEFSGTRSMVRSHLRQKHFVRGKLKMNGEIQPSQLTSQTIVEELN